MRTLVTLCLLLAGFAPSPEAAADFETQVRMERAASGNFTVRGAFNDTVEAEFLVDTGSGLLTVNERVFRHIARSGDVEQVREMAARLADGRVQAVPVYRVARFRLGEHCEIGPVEVAVLTRKGRNILGLSVLGKLAPFAMSVTPPALSLSSCALGEAFAVAD